MTTETEVSQAVKDHLVAQVIGQMKDEEVIQKVLGECIAKLLGDWGNKRVVEEAVSKAVKQRAEALVATPEWQSRIDATIKAALPQMLDGICDAIPKAITASVRLL